MDDKPSGYVIHFFVQDASSFTRYNRMCGDENLGRLLELFCDVIGQCSVEDLDMRYEYCIVEKAPKNYYLIAGRVQIVS